MSDSITAEWDTAGVIAAFDRFGAVLEPYLKEAAKDTATAIQREAQARLQRQLGPGATGKTVANIQIQEARVGVGYVVLSTREPMPNVPIWLERGTSRQRPRPYFNSAALLEEGAHRRRIEQAVQQALNDTGLGA